MPNLPRSGYQINYSLEGPAGAPVLLFSNSLGAELGMWNAQAAEFSKRFRVLRYDNRGHGQSTAPPPPYTLADVAGDAAALIEHVGEKSVLFCGLSLGGMVGMWLGVNRPELVQKLALCNTSALMGPPENWDTRIKTVREAGMQSVVGTVMERWFTEAFRKNSAQFVAPIEESFLKANVEGYVGCCAAIRDMDQRAAIAQINRPTLVIAGSVDPSTPPAMAKEIAAAIPGAQYEELPTAHLSNIEAAAQFNQILGRFLA